MTPTVWRKKGTENRNKRKRGRITFRSFAHVTFNFSFLFLPVPPPRRGWYPQRNTVRAGNKIEFPAYLLSNRSRKIASWPRWRRGGGKKTLHQRLGGETFLPHKPVSLRRGKKTCFCFLLPLPSSFVYTWLRQKQSHSRPRYCGVFLSARTSYVLHKLLQYKVGRGGKEAGRIANSWCPFQQRFLLLFFCKQKREGKLCDAAAIF